MSTLRRAAVYRRFRVLRLSRELLEQSGPEYATWLDGLAATRQVVRGQSTDPERTGRFLHQLASRPLFERSLPETVATPGSRHKTLAAIPCMEPSAGAACINPGRHGSNSMAHQPSTVRAPHPPFWGLLTSGGSI